MASHASNNRERLRQQQDAAARARRTTRMVGAIAGVLALVLVAVFAFVLVSGLENRSGPTPPNANADGTALRLGPHHEGKPTVTLYLDYQCPICKAFEDTFGAALEQGAADGEWTLEMKTLMFLDGNLSNTSSTRAALAASCAATVDAYSAVNREIFAHQGPERRGVEGYSDELLREQIPATVGLTGERLTRFQSCYDTKETGPFTQAVERSAYRERVTQTPTLAVNGKVVDLAGLRDPSLEAVKAFILAQA